MRMLPVFLLLFAAGCRDVHPVPEARPERKAVETLPSLVAAFAAGSRTAEARLVAAGAAATPYLRPLLDAPNEELRRRTQWLLLSAGEDMDLTVGERVGLLLFLIGHPEPHPFDALVAVSQLRELGASARPALEAAAKQAGPEGATARRLLSREAP